MAAMAARGTLDRVKSDTPTAEQTTAPEPEVEPEDGPRLPVQLEGRVTTLARRFASVEQQIGVRSLRARGVIVVPWKSDEPVTAVIEAVKRLRQSMRRAVR